jgi:hypothetical protein
MYSKFYNLTNLYPGGFPDSIERETRDEYYNIIRVHISENNKYHDGDIIFIGSTYETRQEYGFYYICKNCTDFDCKTDKLCSRDMTTPGVYYKHAIEELEIFCTSFFGYGLQEVSHDDIIEDVKQNGQYE